MKRGPTKGYTRANEAPENFDTSRRGSRKRSSSGSYKDEINHSNPELVSLPPLAHYLPQPGAPTRLQSFLGSRAQPQQQFWKVPYHEYQQQRRSSVDSMASDASNRVGSEQLAYPPSQASSGSQLYSMPQLHGPQRLPEAENGVSDDRRNSLNLPSFHRVSTPPAGGYLHYPYSQFNVLPQQEQTAQQTHFNVQRQQLQPPPYNQEFKEFDEGFHSRKGSDVSVAISPSCTAQVSSARPAAAQDLEDRKTPNSTTPNPSKNPESPRNPNPNHRDASPNSDVFPDGRKVKSRRSVHRKDPVSQSPANSQSSSDQQPIVTYGKIPDKQLIDIYFEFIHPNFPVIPVNKSTLTDDLLIVNTQPISSVHELNSYILHWFRNSLELLVRVALKKATGPSHDYSNGVVDILDSQSAFIGALNECFQRVVDIHPGIRESEKSISSKIKFIYLSTFIILNYILAFVGYDNSFVLGMSVSIYNEFKLYRYLMYDEVPVQSTDGKDSETAPQKSHFQMNGDHGSDSNAKSKIGYQILFKRLYVLLVVFDSLQSCAFGVPKLISVPLAELTDETFKYSRDEWSVERDLGKFKSIRQALALGQVLSSLSTGRKSIGGNSQEPLLKKEDWKEFCNTDGTASLFAHLLMQKHELMTLILSLATKEEDAWTKALDVLAQISDGVCKVISSMHNLLALIMKINPTNSIDPNNRPPLSQGDFERVDSSTATISDENGETRTLEPAAARQDSDTDNYDVYKKLLGLNGGRQKETAQGTVSPFVITIVLEVSNILELVKHLPTCMIGAVVNQLPTENHPDAQKQSHKLVMTLSSAMNELVQVTSLISLLKPFKMFEHTLHPGRNSTKVSTELLRQKYAPTIVTSPSKDCSSPGQSVVQTLLDFAWGLVDDEELGWL